MQKFAPQPPEKLLENLEKSEQQAKGRIIRLQEDLEHAHETEDRKQIEQQITEAEQVIFHSTQRFFVVVKTCCDRVLFFFFQKISDVLSQRALIMSHLEVADGEYTADAEGVQVKQEVIIMTLDPPDLTEV